MQRTEFQITFHNGNHSEAFRVIPMETTLPELPVEVSKLTMKFCCWYATDYRGEIVVWSTCKRGGDG